MISKPIGEKYTPEDFYEKEIARLDKGIIREGNKRDKIVMIFSSGAITLSVSAVFNVSNTTTLIGLSILWIAWIFLIVSIFSIFIGYELIIEVFKIRMKKLQVFKNELRDGKLNPKYSGEVYLSKWVYYSNWLSLISLIIGLSLLLLFGGYNINNMSNNNRENTKSISEHERDYGGVDNIPDLNDDEKSDTEKDND